MASEAKILQPIAPVASVYCRINHELDLSNRHAIVLQPGKILLNSRWERMSFGKRRFPSEARSAEKKKKPGMKLNTT